MNLTKNIQNKYLNNYLKYLGILVIGIFFIACQGEASNHNKTSTQTSQNSIDASTSSAKASTQTTNNDMESKVDSKASDVDLSKPMELRVGHEDAYYPFTSIKDGKPLGYDLDVIKAIGEIDPNLTIKYSGVPWASVILGLDSGRFNVIANQIGKTKVREEKYIFSKYPYFISTSQLIVRGGDDSIKTVADLKGKTLGANIGANHTLTLENYDKAHGNLFKIKYYKDLNSLLTDLSLGRIDGTLNDPASIKYQAQTQHLNLKALPLVFAINPIYFMYEKNDTALRDRIDVDLKKAIDSGKLKELSLKWFGDDQTSLDSINSKAIVK
ncbi:transporter substrate-binding domain-containing protein [Helicobacter sp. 11S02629-2]|uniref:transporter substrate-binding domain-containing protein n=1 Tax=Helicobacter sp. 11S02629-2 TaxID=1476195 RepID=UPI000BA4F328|nr:transporter substrate-binding domain-containing protein [Helicobacter sp. 11S02629-2]PAF44619.1 hypothetical protein BKH40_05150 [Helicobacter sp. 11S02629-2]